MSWRCNVIETGVVSFFFFLFFFLLLGGSPSYGSDYEEEVKYTTNGHGSSAQPPYHSPENELLKKQLIDHHRDSPRPPFSQPQMVQGRVGRLPYLEGFY